MRFTVPLTLALLLIACAPPTPLLEQIKQEGELIVVTRNSPTTYYKGRNGMAGFEYELVQEFAKALGVKTRFIVPDQFDQILPIIARGEAHFAAAGLTVTERRETLVKFGPSYQEITQQLVYRQGSRRPKRIEDTSEGSLEIIAGSSHEEELRRRQAESPGLQWVALPDMESEELLYLVQEQLIDYTIADSNEVMLNRRFYPKLKVAFNLTEPQELAWAFPHSKDKSLYNAAIDFLARFEDDGRLGQLIERHYGHVENLNYVDHRTFKRHVAKRLPLYISFFQQAAEAIEIDWKLLAAIGYQESHWNPKAVSPTGVRGIMMLTKATAGQLNIKDRANPEQSIHGGARYIQMLERKIPERIQEPDRLWLALAGYNIGFAHLEDARILTQRNGDNSDKWADVKHYLPLLTQQKYYKTLKHGYARGRVSVQYVDNIRSYYDLLQWITSQEDKPPPKTWIESYLLSMPPSIL